MSELGFMLVHGGGHDSRCWEPLMPHLDGPTLAIDLPGRGRHPAALSGITVSDFVDSAVADLDNFHDAQRVVLVGHSMAGLTIPGVAMPELGREWPALRDLASSHRLTANDLTDAWIAAAVRTLGIRLVTFDRGFARLLGRGHLTVLDPR